MMVCPNCSRQSDDLPSDCVCDQCGRQMCDVCQASDNLCGLCVGTPVDHANVVSDERVAEQHAGKELGNVH